MKLFIQQIQILDIGINQHLRSSKQSVPAVIYYEVLGKQKSFIDFIIYISLTSRDEIHCADRSDLAKVCTASPVFSVAPFPTAITKILWTIAISLYATLSIHGVLVLSCSRCGESHYRSTSHGRKKPINTLP